MEGLLPTGWTEFTGLDMGMMLSIAVLAFLLERGKTVPDSVALFVPFAIGLVWGAWGGIAKGWGLGPEIMKGAFVNGAGASVIGRSANIALKKWWDTGGTATPNAPPSNN